jgi:hypothetical protein
MEIGEQGHSSLLRQLNMFFPVGQKVLSLMSQSRIIPSFPAIELLGNVVAMGRLLLITALPPMGRLEKADCAKLDRQAMSAVVELRTVKRHRQLGSGNAMRQEMVVNRLIAVSPYQVNRDLVADQTVNGHIVIEDMTSAAMDQKAARLSWRRQKLDLSLAW